MEIKTKFGIGDKVYTLLNNAICQVKIENVDVIKSEQCCFISYKVRISDDCDGNVLLADKISEKDLYATIPNLFKSLEDNVIEYNDDWDNESVF